MAWHGMLRGWLVSVDAIGGAVEGHFSAAAAAAGWGFLGLAEATLGRTEVETRQGEGCGSGRRHPGRADPQLVRPATRRGGEALKEDIEAVKHAGQAAGNGGEEAAAAVHELAPQPQRGGSQ